MTHSRAAVRIGPTHCFNHSRGGVAVGCPELTPYANSLYTVMYVSCTVVPVNSLTGHALGHAILLTDEERITQESKQICRMDA